MTSPLNIGVFQAGYPVPDGTTTAVHGLAVALARLGHKITIYGCGPEDQLDRLPKNDNLRAHVFPGLAFGNFSVPRQLTQRLEQNQDRIQLLIVNTMFNPPNVRVSRAAATGGIPYVLSPHDPYHSALLRKNRLRKSIYSMLFEQPMLRNAAAVQVLSADHARWLQPFGVKTVLVVPNGFHPEDVDDSQNTSGLHGELRGSPRLLCLGRFDAQHKGLDLLIGAFAAALRAGSLPASARLYFAGRGEGDLPSLRKLTSSLGIAANTEFAGEVADDVRASKLRECDALLLCSRYDGFGLVALEAMIAAKPVIVSSEAGIAGWVRKAHAGIIAEPSVTGIHSALAEFMNRTAEWTDMGRNGRLYAHQHLTWAQMGAHAAACYRELLDHRRDLKRSEAMRVIGAQGDHSPLQAALSGIKT